VVGGYGASIDRAPESVLSDMTNGFLTNGEAERVYGVILSDGVVDERQTSLVRAKMRDAGRDEEFSFGGERIDYEETLPTSFQDLVAGLLSDRPAPVRQYARGRLYKMAEQKPGILKLPPDQLESVVRSELERVLSTGAAAVAFV
jgi:N-methylhydantoinase B